MFPLRSHFEESNEHPQQTGGPDISALEPDLAKKARLQELLRLAGQGLGLVTLMDGTMRVIKCCQAVKLCTPVSVSAVSAVSAVGRRRESGSPLTETLPSPPSDPDSPIHHPSIHSPSPSLPELSPPLFTGIHHPMLQPSKVSLA